MAKVKFGLENIHLFELTESTNEETGAVSASYGPALAVPGAVNLSLDVNESDPDPFYADDGIYFLPAGISSGYTGSLELALLPDNVKTKFLSFIEDAKGVIVEVAEGTVKYFGMTFDIPTDAKKRRFVYYKCSFARPSLSASTNTDTKTPQTDTVNITVIPTAVEYNLGGEGKRVISGYSTENTNADVYNAWHTSIHEPEEIAGEEIAGEG